MRKIFNSAPAIIDRFIEDTYVMVDIDFTYIQAIEPRETFLDPLGYELSDETTIGYINLLLKS